MRNVMPLVAAAFALLLAAAQAPAAQNVVSKKSTVTFSGRLHAQYHTSSVEGENPDNSFSVRRARLTAGFENPAGTVRGKVQYEMASGQPILKDGYVELLLGERFRVRFGQYKKPFSLWELTSSNLTAVIERGNAIPGSRWKASNSISNKDGLYGDRDVGLMLLGRAKTFSYQVGIFNGNGYSKKSDDDDAKLVAARLVYDLASSLTLGGSIVNRAVSNYTNPSSGAVGRANFQAYEVDLDYGIRYDVSRSGPWVQAEVLFGSNPTYSDEASFFGVAVVSSYNLKRSKPGTIYSLRPALRFDYAKRNTADDETGNILLTPGLDIFFDKYNRVQINLDIDKPQANGAHTEFGLRVQFQQLI